MIAKSNWIECPHKDCLYRAPKRYKGSLYSYNCEYLDLDHYHKIEGKPVKPHTQYGYYHDGETRDLTTKERKMVDRIISLWENRNSK